MVLHRPIVFIVFFLFIYYLNRRWLSSNVHVYKIMKIRDLMMEKIRSRHEELDKRRNDRESDRSTQE